MNIQKFESMTMSSREIAELTGKEHKHVKRDIEVMLNDLGGDTTKFIGIYKDTQNRWQSCFNLPIHLAAALMSKYDVKVSVDILKTSSVKVASMVSALNSFEVPDDLPDMYVYAIEEVDTGNIKLGISKHPEHRLKQLQTGNSSELRLLGAKKAHNRYRDEKALHQANKVSHLIGEWFSNDAVFN